MLATIRDAEPLTDISDSNKSRNIVMSDSECEIEVQG